MIWLGIEVGMRFALILAIWVLLHPASAHAEAWRIAAATTTGIMYVDEDTVIRTGGRVRFWMDTWVRDALPNGDNRMLGLYDADCRDMRWTEVQITFFRDERETRTTRLDPDYRFLAPGTHHRRALEAVCTGNYRTAQPVQNRRALARILFERGQPR